MLNGYVPPLIVLVFAAILLVVRVFKKQDVQAGFRSDILYVVAIIALAAILEIGMGRNLTYQHGPVSLWSGNINSDQNSQQIADPYSVTHIIHGFALYGLAS